MTLLARVNAVKIGVEIQYLPPTYVPHRGTDDSKREEKGCSVNKIK